MAKVKCKLCNNYDDGFCTAKKSGGKRSSVSANKNRVCNLYKPDPISLAHEVDKEYVKSKIPVLAPTWRYYASKKELKEEKEEKGAKFICINKHNLQ